MSVENLINRFGVSMNTYLLVPSFDAGGAPTKTYALVNTMIVYLQPSAPSESMVNGAIRMTTTFKAYIRGADVGEVLTGMRLEDPDGIFYEITGFHRPDMRTTPDEMAYIIATLVVVEGQP